MSTNHTFKVGDKVIRVQDTNKMPVGTVVEVVEIYHKSIKVLGEGYSGWYAIGNFAPYVERTAVLTPLKVFECILAGTPLEYRVKASDHDTWYPVTCADYINLTSTQLCDFRVKPQTVKVNGIDVPAPAQLPTGTLVYYPAVRRGDVQQGYVGTHGMNTYWATEEDAQAVLDAILTSLSK